jgi:hypothetical protein
MRNSGTHIFISSGIIVPALLAVVILAQCTGEKSKSFIILDNRENSIGITNQFMVDFPPGAVSTPVACEVSVKQRILFQESQDFGVVSGVYTISHDGIDLLKNATVRISYNGPFKPGKYAIVKYDGTEFELLETAQRDGFLEAETDELQRFFIISDVEKLVAYNKTIPHDVNEIHPIVGNYFNYAGECLEFAIKGDKLQVKLPERDFYSGWRELDKYRDSDTYEYFSSDGSYVFEYHNQGGEEYILLQTWYSDGNQMKYCKHQACRNQ